MSVKKFNELFANIYIVTGLLKAVFCFAVFFKMITNVISIFNGGGWDYNNFLEVSNIIGFLQFFLIIVSIVMVFVNIERIPGVIPGYLFGLLPPLIEIFTPTFIYVYVVFPNCCLYISAGYKIKRKNSDGRTEIKTSRKKIRNTNWFYKDNSKQIEKMERNKLMAEKEIEEWKELLASGEIDEETYNLEEKRLQEKINKLSK